MIRGARSVAVVALAIAGGLHQAAAQGLESYRAIEDWADLPEGRMWGAVTGVALDPDGRHLWVLDRCGANSCLDSDLDPVFKFDLDGQLVASFGRGLFAWPHGLHVDRSGNVWIADGPTGALAEEASARGMGQIVMGFGPMGDLLLTLGRAGEVGGPYDRARFNAPTDVLVGGDGTIYVLDGHGEGGNNRIVQFTSQGRFVRSWGASGPGPAAGELSDPHAIATDSRGRIFVADRRNVRIQIFGAEGRFLGHWTHFGPPSDIHVDVDDAIYVTDTQTGALPAWYAQRRPDGWVRGIRIGDARTGEVRAFIPSEAEFVTADGDGNVYGAHVPGRKLVKYERVR